MQIISAWIWETRLRNYKIFYFMFDKSNFSTKYAHGFNKHLLAPTFMLYWWMNYFWKKFTSLNLIKVQCEL